MRLKSSSYICLVSVGFLVLSSLVSAQSTPKSTDQTQAELKEEQKNLSDAQVLLSHAQTLLANSNRTDEDVRVANLIIKQANALINTASTIPFATTSPVMRQLAATDPAFVSDQANFEVTAARAQVAVNKSASNKAAGPAFTLMASIDHGKATPLIGVSGDVYKVRDWVMQSDLDRAITATGLSLNSYYAAQKIAGANAANREAFRTLDEQVQPNVVPGSRLTFAGFVAGGVQAQTGKTTSGFGLGPKITLAHGDFTFMLGAYWPDLAAGSNGLKPQLMTGLSFSFLSASK
jgi:hypothetical protein